MGLNILILFGRLSGMVLADRLLMYAVLLTMSGDLDGAEMFFSACTDFHPLFLEGWTAWYIFYLLTERAEAADLTLILGQEQINSHSLKLVFLACTV